MASTQLTATESVPAVPSSSPSFGVTVQVHTWSVAVFAAGTVSPVSVVVPVPVKGVLSTVQAKV